MKVRDLIRIKRPLTVINTYSNEGLEFAGWIELTPLAQKEFRKVLNMECWPYGRDVMVVKCSSRGEVEDVVDFFECIDGEPLTPEEWDSYFIEPDYERSWEDD